MDNAHNVYLGWLVNCGALGLAAYLWLLLSAAQSALGGMAKPLTAALLLALLCGAVHGLFGLGLSLSEPVFWIVPGLLCASRRNDMEASS